MKRTARRTSRVAVILIVFFLVLLSVCVWFAFVARKIVTQSKLDERRPADAIVVLGAAEYAGKPSPVLRARLDHALDLFLHGYGPVIITTGGAGDDPTYTEGGVGRDYLGKRGVPDPNLIAETQGDNTWESVQRVAVIMHKNRLRRALVVSDAYHMFRVKAMMSATGIETYGAPRQDSLPRTPKARFHAVMREALSFTLWKLHITKLRDSFNG